MDTPTHPAPAPGRLIARGVCRALPGHGFIPLEEVVPTPGLRVDVMALGPAGEVWVIECKSCRADFVTDRKWQGYLGWCDRFFFAVDPDFPAELLPDDAGLIIADRHDAEILRLPEPRPLAPARRRALMLRFARLAGQRLMAATG
ncbi:MAG: MmcB family DNA repair protein [Gemmobacter sp.]